MHSQRRLDTRFVKELRHRPKVLILCWITTRATAERMLERERQRCREKQEEELTLQVALESFRPEGCAGRSETGYTTNGKRELFKNKDQRQSSSGCTACMFVAVPHLKGSPRLGCNRFWFHMAPGLPIMAKMIHVSALLRCRRMWWKVDIAKNGRGAILTLQNLGRIYWNGSH